MSDAPFCQQCGARCWKNKHESKAQFARRRFCSRSCVKSYQAAHPEEFQSRLGPADAMPRTLKEWPSEARFDAPGMIVPDTDNTPFRRPASTEWARWI